jgi:hypothetical protein
MKQLNERTTAFLKLTFKDKVGKAVIPISGRYQVSDMDSKTVILSWVDFVPTASTHELTIKEEHNRILDLDKTTETRAITVVVQYALGGQTPVEYLYEIVNLYSLPPSLDIIPTSGYALGGTATIVGTNI